MAFFALRFISPEVVQRFFGSDVPIFNIAAAGIAVGLLVTPLGRLGGGGRDVRGAELAPGGLRGSGRPTPDDEHPVVMPAAVSGITAALILGISRAIGETMIVAIVAGGDRRARSSRSIRSTGVRR